MPRLWTETIEGHRRAVRDATLDATAELVAEHGPAGVTMSQIAERTGIGRATLYKYFPDVEAVLMAWHERQIAAHLQHLARVRDQAGGADARLRAVLEAYAQLAHQHPQAELAAALHRGAHMAGAQRHLQDFVGELVTAGVAEGSIRDDVTSEELTRYCLAALAAATGAASRAAVRRLVTVTLDGLRPR